MTTPSSPWRRILVTAMVVAVRALVIGGVVVGARRDGPLDTSTDLEQLDRYGEVPAFRLTERSGRRVTTADLRGAVWVVHGRLRGNVRRLLRTPGLRER